MATKVEPNDTVWTTNQMYFQDGYNQKTGDPVELKLPRKHACKVLQVLPDGELEVDPDGVNTTRLCRDEYETIDD